MGVDAISPVGNTNIQPQRSAADQAAREATLDYDTFLTLLIAQMQNQDPTEPMDATDQIAQLATFSQVEQTIQTNTNLETLIQKTNLSQASSLIGQTIISADGQTTGVVEQVRILSDGSVAILEDGSEVSIENGIVIGGQTQVQ